MVFESRHFHSPAISLLQWMVTLSYNGASSLAINAHTLASDRSTENESHDDCSQINQIQPASVVDTMTPNNKTKTF
jgi:hypothetical protein